MVYKCSVCGYVYDEEKEGVPFSKLTQCPDWFRGGTQDICAYHR